MARAPRSRAAAPKPRARKPPAPAAQRPKPKAKAKAKAKGSKGSMLAALDARIPAHLPPPQVSGPYTIVRDRSRATITTTGSRTVLVLGAYQSSYSHAGANDAPVPNYCPVLGYYGAGATAPVNWTPVLSDWALSRQTPVSTGSAVRVSVSLHSMTVSIQNSKGTALTEGFVYAGSLTGCPNRSLFADADAAYTNFLRRAQMKRHSAVELAAHPLDLVAYPVDVTEWSSMQPLYQAASGDESLLNHSKDTMSHIVVCWDGTASAITYSVEVSTEWRVIYHQDVELASTHQHHPPASQGVWSGIVRGAEVVGGEVVQMLAPGAMRAFGGAVGGLARLAGKSLGLNRRGPLMLTN